MNTIEDELMLSGTPRPPSKEQAEAMAQWIATGTFPFSYVQTMHMDGAMMFAAEDRTEGTPEGPAD